MIREEPGLDPFKEQNHAEVIKTVYPRPLLFAPGQKWAYSNTGYALLGDIIRVVTGRPWAEYITEKVFVPSGHELDVSHQHEGGDRQPRSRVLR